MREIEKKLKQIDIEELSMFYNFFHIAALILNGRYSKAKEMLENSGLDLDELMFFKTFVYEKLQIHTSHKICFDMLSTELQGRYKLIMAKDCSNNEVKEEMNKLITMYELEGSDLSVCKKTAWKEILVKGSENLKQILCKYVSDNKKTYPDYNSFESLVTGEKSLRDSLLNMGHIIRIWLLMPNHAITFYEQVIHLDPQDPIPYFFLGITYRGKGENKKAIDSYTKALELNPKYSDCLFNLGNIYFEFLKNLTKAEECYKSALEYIIEGSAEKHIATVGLIYNLLGEIEKKKRNIYLSAENYLNGIKGTWGFIDNYKDLGEVLRNLNINQLGNIVEYVGAILSNTEHNINLDPISQLPEAIKESLQIQSHPPETIELLGKIYKTLESLALYEEIEESKRSLLKKIVEQLKFVGIMR